MTFSIKISLYWLLLGPVLALLIAIASWFGFDHLSPGKLSGFPEMVATYPLALLLSLLTPWGWLMYGGFLFMSSGKYKVGVRCSVAGGVILGIFLPVWATFLNQ
ncbi:MAG: hypothetical protein GY731_05210 [Gammaproteobacteria bacterium]|nr:hypothetical protein [Gammaproteobacteria bacterium]